jgi:type II secretory pathway component GspD/PulD (secretin)
MKLAATILAATLTASIGGSAWAQTAAADSARQARQAIMANPTVANIHTYYLKNVSQPSDANEIYTALRNMLPADVKSFLVSSDNAIVVLAGPDQFAIVEELIKNLDRAHRTYRLTYTVSEMDGSKRIDTQHFAMVVAPGQATTLKQGSKVPVVTGSTSASAAAGVQTQFTYLDIGINFEATVDEFANGIRLRTSVDQTSVGEQKSVAEVQEPVVRQTSLKSSSFLTPGKPLTLGSLDVPGSTRHLDIEVVMEQVP